MGIKHTKVSEVPDGEDPTQIQGSDWNAEHTIDDPAAVRTDLGLGSAALQDSSAFDPAGTGDDTLAAAISYTDSAIAADVDDVDVHFTDVTTGNASSTKHGFQKKSPADATKFLNGAATPDYAAVKESDLALTDVTSNDVTSTKHGLAPKSPADATKFLNGAATPAFALVKDSDLSTSDVTTNDVSITKHGFAPKGPNDPTKFLDATGAWAVPGSASATPLYPFNSGTGLLWRYNSLLSQTDLSTAMFATKLYDISGNANHSLSNTTNPPKWVLGGFMGRYPAVYFSGFERILIDGIASIASPFKGSIVFVGWQFAAGGGNSHLYNWSGNPIGFGSTSCLDFMYNGTLPAAHAYSANSLLKRPPFMSATDSSHIVVGMHSYDGASSVQRMNARDETKSPGTTASGSTNKFTIGSDASTGVGGGVAQAAKAVIVDFAIFNFALSVAQMNALDVYYKALYPGLYY